MVDKMNQSTYGPRTKLVSQ